MPLINKQVAHLLDLPKPQSMCICHLLCLGSVAIYETFITIRNKLFVWFIYKYIPCCACIDDLFSVLFYFYCCSVDT